MTSAADTVALVDAVDTIDQHPELVTLAAKAPPGLEVAATTRSIARRLLGAPAAEEPPLATLLVAIARTELELLEMQCRMDPVKSGIATISLMRALLARYPDAEATAPSSPADTRADRADDMTSLRASLAVLAGRRLPDSFPLPRFASADGDADPLRVAAALAEHLAVAEAAAAAWDAVEQCEEMLAAVSALLPGLGWDFSTGALTRTLMHHLHRLSALLGKLPVLQRIVDELGRMEAHTRTRATREHGGRDTVTGVYVGGELAEVLPCELALLGQPETEDLFYQRLVEHRLLCLEHQGAAMHSESATETRGPILACVDTSGSMQGAPEAVAKALVLAVVRQARARQRPVRLLLFGGPNELTDLDIRHQRGELEGLLAFLAMGFRAGTDFDTPLCRALNMLDDPELEKADILVVTDGLCQASQGIVSQVEEAKRARRVRILSVVIAGDARGVSTFSDQVWQVDPTAPLEGGLDLRLWERV